MRGAHVGRRRWLIAVIVALWAIFALGPPAFAEGGVIEGKVRIGTSGAALPTGLEVTLERLDPNGESGATQQAKVDEQGAFRFATVDATGGYTYTMSTKYREVAYHSAPLSFGAGETTKPAELTVYETTEDDAALSIDLSHSVLEPDLENQRLWVIEVAVFNNGGDRTYVGDAQRTVNGKRRTLRFSLPDGAQQPEPMDGLNPDGILDIVNGFADSEPMLPGKHQVAYSYVVPLQGKDAIYSRAVDYPTKRFTVLTADTGGLIEAVQLTKGEPSELGDRRYQTYFAQDLPVGSAVMLRISGLGAPANQSADLTKIVGGMAALAVLVGIAVFLRRRSAAAASDERTPGHAREQLLAAIADLDDAFEAGAIDEEEYRTERTAQKKRLAKLIQAQAEG